MQYLKWAGYDAVEISALQGKGAFGDPLGEHLHLDRWREEASEIKTLVEDLQLPITAMEVGPLDEDRILKALEAAEEIGIPIINIGPSGRSDVPNDLNECISRMAKLIPRAEQAGVTLCVKAHVGASIHDTQTTLREAMAEIPSPAFGIDMDPSHIHRAGEVPKDALEQVVSRASNTFTSGIVSARAPHRGRRNSNRVAAATSIFPVTARCSSRTDTTDPSMSRSSERHDTT